MKKIVKSNLLLFLFLILPLSISTSWADKNCADVIRDFLDVLKKNEIEISHINEKITEKEQSIALDYIIKVLALGEAIDQEIKVPKFKISMHKASHEFEFTHERELLVSVSYIGEESGEKLSTRGSIAHEIGHAFFNENVRQKNGKTFANTFDEKFEKKKALNSQARELRAKENVIHKNYVDDYEGLKKARKELKNASEDIEQKLNSLQSDLRIVSYNRFFRCLNELFADFFALYIEKTPNVMSKNKINRGMMGNHNMDDEMWKKTVRYYSQRDFSKPPVDVFYSSENIIDDPYVLVNHFRYHLWKKYFSSKKYSNKSEEVVFKLLHFFEQELQKGHDLSTVNFSYRDFNEKLISKFDKLMGETSEHNYQYGETLSALFPL